MGFLGFFHLFLEFFFSRISQLVPRFSLPGGHGEDGALGGLAAPPGSGGLRSLVGWDESPSGTGGGAGVGPAPNPRALVVPEPLGDPLGLAPVFRGGAGASRSAVSPAEGTAQPWHRSHRRILAATAGSRPASAPRCHKGSRTRSCRTLGLPEGEPFLPQLEGKILFLLPALSPGLRSLLPARGSSAW